MGVTERCWQRYSMNSLPIFCHDDTTEPQWNKQPKALVGSLLWVAGPQILPLSYMAFPKQLTGSKTGFEAARTQTGTHLRWWGHRCSISCYMSVSSATSWFLLWKTQWVTAMAISGKLWLSHLAQNSTHTWEMTAVSMHLISFNIKHATSCNSSSRRKKIYILRSLGHKS